MPQAKRASNGKRPSKAVSVLGIAGMSLAASTGGSSADMSPASVPAPPAGSVENTRHRFGFPRSTRRKSPTSAWRRFISSTKMTSETPSRAYKSLFEVAGAAAAADMAAEAAAFEAAEGAFEAAAAASEAAALAFAAAEAAALASAAAAAAGAAAGAGAGSVAAACHGEVAPSARRKRLAITLPEAGRYARV